MQIKLSRKLLQQHYGIKKLSHQNAVKKIESELFGKEMTMLEFSHEMGLIAKITITSQVDPLAVKSLDPVPTHITALQHYLTNAETIVTIFNKFYFFSLLPSRLFCLTCLCAISRETSPTWSPLAWLSSLDRIITSELA